MNLTTSQMKYLDHNNKSMYELFYFKKGNSLCGSDFDNIEKVEHINIKAISSISQVEQFKLPLSGQHKGKYAIVRMINGDTYYISDKSQLQLIYILKSLSDQINIK